MKVLALCAGLAMSSVAMAQDPIAEFVPASQVQQLPAECFVGALRPLGDISPAAQTTVYNNQSHTGYWTSATVASNIGLDDIALMPGTAHTYPLLITAMNFAFSLRTLAGANFDMEVSVFDSVTVAAAAGSPVTTGQTPIATFVVPIRNVTAIGVWTTGSVSLAPLTGGGITLPDGGCFVQVRYLQPTTTTLMPAADIACAYQSGIVNTGTNWASMKPMGSSHNGMWVNNDNDATPMEVADRVGFAYPAQLDWAIKMEITEDDVPPPCAADFNADGVVDFFDYLDFVDQFSIGCP